MPDLPDALDLIEMIGSRLEAAQVRDADGVAALVSDVVSPVLERLRAELAEARTQIIDRGTIIADWQRVAGDHQRALFAERQRAEQAEAERDRYRLAWQSARKRAKTYAKINDDYWRQLGIVGDKAIAEHERAEQAEAAIARVRELHVDGELAEDIARAFHDTYEKLAPEYGYKTRRDSAVSWGRVPEQNRSLMVATVRVLIESDRFVAVVAPEVERLRAELAEARLVAGAVADMQRLETYLAALQRAEQAEAAIADVRRLCDLTIATSCRAQAIDQAVDTLAVLDRALDASTAPEPADHAHDHASSHGGEHGPASVFDEVCSDVDCDRVECLHLGTCYQDALADAPESPQETEAKVPDRIDYDQDGELDDVVVNNCMAHLERLDTGRWYLGLYGDDGRIVQIDIASKTGRAEVIGFVTYSEGIAPDLERWAKTAPESTGEHIDAHGRTWDPHPFVESRVSCGVCVCGKPPRHHIHSAPESPQEDT